VDIVGFVEKEQLPAFFYESPYYLGPGKRGEKGYALLREVLVRTGRIGIATVVIRTRAHLAALYPVEDMLVLNTLRFMNEIRDPSQVEVPDLEGAKVSPREIEMAERLVEDMEMKWDPAKYHDTYRDDLLKLIEQKSHGKLKKAKAPRATKGAEVIDFAALLEKSLAGKGKAKAPAVKAKRKPGSSRAATSRRAA
jgi:DNA end-binding protein Ku